MFKIPTLPEAFEITKKYSTFYYKEEIYFYIFHYRTPVYEDFILDTNKELRGIVYDKKTGQHWIGLHKFFNQGETSYVLDKIDVKECRLKVDGSLIMPIVYNNQIALKTQKTFRSIQTEKAYELLDNRYQKMIYDLYEDNLIPYFEYISPTNQIVVPYNKDELILTQIRNNLTGEYLPYEKVNKIAKIYQIPIIPLFEYTFDKLMELSKTIKGIEGWVIWNGKQDPLGFRKIKTEWYLKLHHIISPNNLMPHFIIQTYLDDKIDDVISTIPIDNPKRKYILEIVDKVRLKIKEISDELDKIKQTENSSDRKEIAIKYKEHPYFPLIMSFLYKDVDKQDIIISFLKKKLNSLKLAEKFLETNKIN